MKEPNEIVSEGLKEIRLILERINAVLEVDEIVPRNPEEAVEFARIDSMVDELNASKLEQNLIGGIILAPDDIQSGVIAGLRVSLFRTPLCRRAFEAIVSLRKEGRPIDILTIHERAKQQVPGPRELSHWADEASLGTIEESVAAVTKAVNNLEKGL